ncbi:MAG TPA: UDP-N-acetylmuramoyl-L-alanyl-D-glutamate--2,6-diaminopimelate ligase [Syntrophorhabdaceae bacterium]|nr:UDP-N-acetylmuramoyl-L-alanyl-D-glutamate--2,6-diaminopimelate ligase [Syntrophorhabdaceae bacterium]HQM81307.1 UDP-N-acetylmuramoyl-L-alanyl-D-glutamate--2,6-diaminopimelate ligase [Syntrophorhabdaceae bacterium]
MRLNNLIENMPFISIKGSRDLEIAGLTKDSRAVREGYMFFATSKSGTYMDDALQRGAKVIVTDKEPDRAFECAIIVEDVAASLGEAASTFYGFPSKQMHIAGVTGTNGKTTTTYLIESVLINAGRKAGVIGTISYRYDGKVLKADNTTPGAAETHGLLKEMHLAGVTNVAMEVSSHALDQKRVEGVDFDIGIFTNLTHDHLDYHGDLESYKGAKRLLFEHYLKKSTKGQKFAILNIDDPSTRDFVIAAPTRTLSYSTKGYADAHLIGYSEDINGLKLDASLLGNKVSLFSPMIGVFNASNILAACLYGHVTGIPYDNIRKGIEGLEGVPGRLERIVNEKGLAVFVDYAHTPDALGNVLALLNRLKKGRLILVFGCGGDRDKGKRPIMGKIASHLADLTIITSDNPRTEDPGNIIADITYGFSNAPFRVVEDRKEAIREAIKAAQEDDVVLVAGKGHEDYQLIGDRILHFSDREVIEGFLNVAS